MANMVSTYCEITNTSARLFDFPYSGATLEWQESLSWKGVAILRLDGGWARPTGRGSDSWPNNLFHP